MKQKMLALLLVLMLAVGLMPTVYAAEVLGSGSAGKNVTWTMYDDGRLVFSGSGSTMDTETYSAPEWSRYIGEMKHVIFEEGITRIGDYLLYNSRSAIHDSIETLTLPASLEEVGTYAFTSLDGLTTVCISDLESWCQVEFDGCSNPLDNQVALSLNGSVIETLVIPEGVTELKDYAFKGCSSIRTVLVHEDVTEIGSFVFNTCENLESVWFQGDAPAFGEHVFTLSALTAYYPAGADGWAEVIAMDLGGTVEWVPYEPLPFDDVPTDAFYFESVAWAVEAGITKGLTETSFGPNVDCNRAQVVTFLWRAEGCPEPAGGENPFADVKESDFYYKAVLWAVEQGITNGTDAAHFSPLKTCNRAEVVTFLHRAAGSPDVENGDNPFADVPADVWYTAPILWAVENGITNGMGGGAFGVNNTCNRAQIVTFLYRAYH